MHVWEPHVAGVPRLASAFADHQTRAGHDCLVLSPADSWLDLQVAPREDWTLTRRSASSWASAAQQLRHAARRFRPEVVHLHSFFAGLVGRAPGVLPPAATVVYQPHAWAFDIGGPLGSLTTTRLERAASRRTHGLVTNCADELARGRKHGITTPGSAVGVTVDIGHLRTPSPQERGAARSQLGVPARTFLAVVLGRIARQKGQDRLVGAWEQRPPASAQLLLQGDGDTGALRALAPTTWGTSITHRPACADVRTALWAADILVLPSRYETVSLVSAEALACGTPVLAAEVDGIEELLGPLPDRAGRIVPQHDPAGLVDAVAELAADPTTHARLTAASRPRAEARCAVDVVGERVLNSYRHFAKGSS